MIRGRLSGEPGRLRPVVLASVSLPAQNAAEDVLFLIDTGADSTILSPVDVIRLRLDRSLLRPAGPMIGLGGATQSGLIDGIITLGSRTFAIPFLALFPGSGVPQAVQNRIPSLLGRDIVAHFALFLEERTKRVLLLEPAEADRLALA